MANPTEQNASTELTSTAAASQTPCLDRFHDGLDNGDFTTATEVSYVAAIIVNSLTCPFTVLLNVLVIIAVKRRPRLRTNTNILLACLAVVDLLSGFVVQPCFVFWKAFQLNGVDNNCTLRTIHNWLLGLVSLLTLLHLSIVSGERIIAIKYTMRYLSIVTPKNMRIAVITVWVFCLVFYLGYGLSPVDQRQLRLASNIVVVFCMITCILFLLIAYAILFRETMRHQKVINTQQLPLDEVERYARENKAFKTTVLVVGALLGSFVPLALLVLFRPKKGYDGLHDVFLPWARTVAMMNSVLNPLIYCWRQKDMRKFFMKALSQNIEPDQEP